MREDSKETGNKESAGSTAPKNKRIAGSPAPWRKGEKATKFEGGRSTRTGEEEKTPGQDPSDRKTSQNYARATKIGAGSPARGKGNGRSAGSSAETSKGRSAGSTAQHRHHEQHGRKEKEPKDRKDTPKTTPADTRMTTKRSMDGRTRGQTHKKAPRTSAGSTAGKEDKYIPPQPKRRPGQTAETTTRIDSWDL